MKTIYVFILLSIISVFSSCAPEMEQLGRIIRREARMECTGNRMLRNGRYLNIETCNNGVDLAINSIRGNIFDAEVILKMCEEDYEDLNKISCQRGVEFVQIIIDNKRERMLSTFSGGPNDVNNDNSEYAQNVNNGPRVAPFELDIWELPLEKSGGVESESV